VGWPVGLGFGMGFVFCERPGGSKDCLRPPLAPHQIPALVPCSPIFWCDVKEGVGSGRKRCCYEEKSDHLGTSLHADGLAAAGGGGTGSNYPGNCQYGWQTAADMSRCGARSAESRPGDYWRIKVKARTHRQICANERHARTYELFWASRLSQRPLYLVNGRRANACMRDRSGAGSRPLRTSAAGQKQSHATEQTGGRSEL